MNKQDLVAVVADAGDISKAKAGEVVDAIFTAIEDAPIPWQ
jgi:DNA-binding protein HU-beta